MNKLGLIGKKLGHSFSPDFFSKKFKDLGITSKFQYSALEFESWSEASKFILSSNYLGFNVTFPYKKDALNICDYLDYWAMKVSAVNTLCIKKDGKIWGYNTDAPGFLQTINDRGIQVKKALILGTGGAAFAVKSALDHMEVEAYFVSRSKQRGDYSYDQLCDDNSIMGETDLIINCTPLGTHPQIYQCPPIPYEQLNSNQILYDLVYNPAESVFLSRGMNVGCKTFNGYEMLRTQAEFSWRIWLDSDTNENI